MSIASSQDAPTPAQAHAFRSGRAVKSATTGAQAQLDSLARAGVITHLVGHGEAIDPLFAVGQLRDLPEVRFVAAFREGVIALGCPDGLPQQLKELAAPISVPPETPDPTLDVQASLDAILQRLATLEGPSGLGAISERLSTIDTMSGETARLVGDLAHAAADTPIQPSQETIKDLLDSPFNALKAEQDAMGGQITAAIAELSERIRTVEGQIDTACEQVASAEPAPAPESLPSTAILTELGLLKEAVPLMSSSLSRVEETLSGAIHHGNARMDQVLTTLTQQIESHADTQQDDAETGAIQALLEDIQHRLELAMPVEPQENMHPTQDTVESVAERTAILSALAQLQETIENLAARPDPVLDLTAQRQSFAQFGTVMKMIVQRLEGTAEQIKESLETTSSSNVVEDHAALGAQLDALPGVLAEALRSSPQAASVVTQLVEIKEQLSHLPAAQGQAEEMMTVLQNLANRPKPILDLTEQRRSFASFTTALATVVQRLEKSADRFGDLPDPQTGEGSIVPIVAQISEHIVTQFPPALDVDALAQHLAAALPVALNTEALLTELRSLPDRIAASPTLSLEDLEGVELKLVAIGDHQAAVGPAIAELERQVAALTAMSPPKIDTTEQRASFAMFSTALAAAVARLETIADGADQTGDAETATQLRALQDAVASIGSNTSGLGQQFETLGSLAALPNQIMQMQTNLETQLAAQEAPHLDLTEQRKGMARFATAAQHVIARLEAVTATLPEQIDAKDAARHRPLMKRMRRMEGQVAALRSNQEDASRDMKNFLERLASDPDEETQLVAPVVEPPTLDPVHETVPETLIQNTETQQSKQLGIEGISAPLDSLRFCFAEVIATQIRKTSEDAAGPAPS